MPTVILDNRAAAGGLIQQRCKWYLSYETRYSNTYTRSSRQNLTGARFWPLASRASNY